jgi:hypothetical protein
VSRGDSDHYDERPAAPRADRSPAARSDAPGREGSGPAGRDRSDAPDRYRTLDRDRFEAPDRDPSTGGVPGRRTVTIRGHGTERYVPPRSGSARRRPPEHRYERPGFRPDRAAMWAVLLGLMFILAAAASAHAATLHALSHLH